MGWGGGVEYVLDVGIHMAFFSIFGQKDSTTGDWCTFRT